VLGHYVRETGALTWEDAIRKMTALPAATVGLVDRGYLAPGMWADIAIFDPRTVIDHATYEDAGQLSEGIRFVLVNGRVALRDGKVTGEKAGVTLRRTRWMPTRPMTTGSRASSSQFRVNAGERTITIDVQQGPRDIAARGVFKAEFVDTKSGWDATDFGVLQSYGEWRSFTARIVMRPTGEPHAATVTIDKGVPHVALDGRVLQ
jgi:adenine deaminase